MVDARLWEPQETSASRALFYIFGELHKIVARDTASCRGSKDGHQGQPPCLRDTRQGWHVNWNKSCYLPVIGENEATAEDALATVRMNLVFWGSSLVGAQYSVYIILLLLVLVLVLLLLLFCRPMYFPRTTLALPPSSNSDPGSHRRPSPTLPTNVRANIPHPKYLYCLQSSAPLTLPFAPTGPRTGRGKLFFFRKRKKKTRKCNAINSPMA